MARNARTQRSASMVQMPIATAPSAMAKEATACP